MDALAGFAGGKGGREGGHELNQKSIRHLGLLLPSYQVPGADTEGGGHHHYDHSHDLLCVDFITERRSSALEMGS
jgi:hypothetical protein